MKVSGGKAELIERLNYLDSVGRHCTGPELGKSACVCNFAVSVLSVVKGVADFM